VTAVVTDGKAFSNKYTLTNRANLESSSVSYLLYIRQLEIAGGGGREGGGCEAHHAINVSLRLAVILQ
jgi:hypothetical protein